MHKFIYFFFFTISILISGCSEYFTSNRFNFYSCSSEEAALNCSQCQLEKDITIQLDVNIENSVVISNLFEGKKNLGGGALEKCKIIDKRNWQCGNEGAYGEFNTFHQNTEAMTNGIYHSIFRSKMPRLPTLNNEPKNTESFYCAK